VFLGGLRPRRLGRRSGALATADAFAGSVIHKSVGLAEGPGQTVRIVKLDELQSYALVVVATLYIATAIRTEAGLAFLGLGIPPPTPSWGNILSEGRQYIKCCPWITTFSGLAIMLAVLAFNLVGDALRDLLDPRLRGE